MSNTITIELCQEDRKRIDDLTGVIALLTSIIGSALPKETRTAIIEEATETSTAPQTEEKPEPVETDTPVESVQSQPEPEVVAPIEEPVEEPKPAITHEMIQSRIKQLIAKGTPEQNAGARKAVTSRARNISSLTPDQLEPVWADLVALGEV